ncbi:mitochondrial ornithine transporter 1 [Tribolium castaneum]|uniref:Mitochondrial ornithine transporter 1 n=1 Tax=Tribolium castaneum TaxID=7070 RepID=D2A299_TRICA|nr:PREDICTED: mitochondrial ornithine transporter 1 [Tribolium castaneum]EFA02052.1 Congested-like trachea protein [Tribolium castaneum]|eukprot:XP_974555.1 PREDICTED: mitochondrial ornithine transporter 1 [Tribolium castaneum]
MSESKRDNHAKDGIIDFTAGFLGGIALVYVGQPLDTVKVKMQTFPSLYNNMIDCFMKTLRADGIYRGLYAGTVPALAANITENSVLFLCYGFCQKFIQKVSYTEHVADLSMMQNATAGFLASFFSSVAICPTELLKCKLQAMFETQKQQEMQGFKVVRVGPMKLAAQILKTEGPLGFFHGLVPTLVREMPGYFFFFGTYEGTRTLLARPGESKDDIGLFKTMVAGALGGMSFWTLTYPVDVAKSRIQVTNSKMNMVAMILQISRREGFRQLYNGLTPTLVRTIPSTATLFATYEYSKRFLHQIF